MAADAPFRSVGLNFVLGSPIVLKPIDTEDVLATALLILLMALCAVLTKWLMNRPGWPAGFGGWYRAFTIASITTFWLLMVMLLGGTLLTGLLGF